MHQYKLFKNWVRLAKLIIVTCVNRNSMIQQENQTNPDLNIAIYFKWKKNHLPARILTACGVKRLLILLMSTSRSSSFKSKLSKIDGSLKKKKAQNGKYHFTDNYNTTVYISEHKIIVKRITVQISVVH